jgi:hypothetical protein
MAEEVGIGGLVIEFDVSGTVTRASSGGVGP